MNNEQLKGEFYEQKTGDPYFLEYMFHEAYAHNPNIQLFLNDYDIVNNGIHVAVRRAVLCGKCSDLQCAQAIFDVVYVIV